MRRRAARLTAAILLAASGAAACGGSGDAKASAGSTTRPPATDAAAPTSSVADPVAAPDGCADVAPSGEYAVGRRQVTVVDPTRPTAADPGRGIEAATSRTLPLSVLYPAAGEAGEAGAFADDAEARAGRYPVVIYSHGVDSDGTERNDVLAAWARSGYLVVAPTYPLSSHPGGQISDVANQPADVMFVAAQLADPASPLAPVAAHGTPGCLALAGHSLGAMTTVGATYDPCCRPEGQRAAITIAGALFGPTAGFDWAEAPEVPLLLVHGDKDARVPFAKSPELRSTLPGDEWLLALPGGPAQLHVRAAPERGAQLHGRRLPRRRDAGRHRGPRCPAGRARPRPEAELEPPAAG